MKHVVLSHPERVATGFTDLFVLSTKAAANQGTDFTASATTQTWTLTTLNQGDIFDSEAAIDVVTALAGPASMSGALSINSQPVMDSINLGQSSSRGLNGDYNAGGGDVVSFTVNTIGGNVSAVTAGEVRVWTTIRRIADRTRLQV